MKDIQGQYTNYERGRLIQAAYTFIVAFEHRRTDKHTYDINKIEFLRLAGNLAQMWNFSEVPDGDLYHFARLLYFAAEGYIPCE